MNAVACKCCQPANIVGTSIGPNDSRLSWRVFRDTYINHHIELTFCFPHSLSRALCPFVLLSSSWCRPCRGIVGLTLASWFSPSVSHCHAQTIIHSSHHWCHCIHLPWGTVVALLLLPPYAQVAAGRAWSSLVYLICDWVDPHPLGRFPGRYKLAWPRTKKKLASICHAITDPPVTKIRLWASFGV